MLRSQFQIRTDLTPEQNLWRAVSSSFDPTFDVADAPSPDFHPSNRPHLLKLLETLTWREQNAILMYFGLNDGRYASLRQIGESEKFGIKRERVRQIRNKALRKLHHPSRCRQFELLFVDPGTLIERIHALEKNLQDSQCSHEKTANDLACSLTAYDSLREIIMTVAPDTLRRHGIRPTLNIADKPRIKLNIEDLNLGVRAYNCLRRVDINTIASLLFKSYDDLLAIRNLGRRSADEIVQRLADLGLELARDD